MSVEREYEPAVNGAKRRQDAGPATSRVASLTGPSTWVALEITLLAARLVRPVELSASADIALATAAAERYACPITRRIGPLDGRDVLSFAFPFPR